MSYHDIVNQAIELTVITDEDTGTAYLEPRYREVLRTADLHLPGYQTPGDDADKELWEILDLEVKKINAKHNVSHALAAWAYEVLTQTVEPTLLDEENELMKNITEYLQTNQSVKEKQVELDEKEKLLNEKEKLGGTQLPTGINFSKKTEQ